MLAGDEVDGGVLQQGREHKQQTHGHPDIDGFYVGHLRERGEKASVMSRVEASLLHPDFIIGLIVTEDHNLILNKATLTSKVMMGRK